MQSLSAWDMCTLYCGVTVFLRFFFFFVYLYTYLLVSLYIFFCQFGIYADSMYKMRDHVARLHVRY